MALRNLSYYGQASPIDQTEQNLIWYLREELLKTGAYYNITSGFLGYNGENLSFLRPSYQTEHQNFQFWTGLSHQWVWESGLIDTDSDGTPDVNTDYLVAAPIAVSGIYVSGVFYPTATTTGTYAHYIDYNRGGVVFTNALASGLNIWCERTERAAFIYPARSDEYRRIIYEHLRVINNNPPGSGLDNISPENKALLPAIFISVQQRGSTPYELGNLTNFTRFQVNFDIVAEHLHDFHKLRDTVNGLEGYSINLFDVSQAATGSYPLDYLGRVRSNLQTRDELVSSFNWSRGRFHNDAIDIPFAQILPLHRSRTTITFELVL